MTSISDSGPLAGPCYPSHGASHVLRRGYKLIDVMEIWTMWYAAENKHAQTSFPKTNQPAALRSSIIDTDVRERGERGFTLVELVAVVVVVVLLFLAVGGVVSSCNGDGGIENILTGSWEPPFVPLRLSVDTSGAIRIAVSGSIVTPVGVFSAELERKKICHLAVTLGTETRYYPLNQKFSFELPRSLKGSTIVEGDGNCNVQIKISQPGKLHFPGRPSDTISIPQGKGIIRVRSNVAGDGVLLGGRNLGSTPRELVLSSGIYDITVMKAGCVSDRKPLSVVVGELSEIWFRVECPTRSPAVDRRAENRNSQSTATAATTVAAPASNDPNQWAGLAAYYSFDGSARDMTGKGAEGRIYDARLAADRSGRAGSAYAFNGRNSYISFNPSGLPTGSSPRTITSWFKTRSTSGSGGWRWNTIFSYGARSKSRLYMLGVYGGKLAFGGWSDDDHTKIFVADGNWHHTAVVYDGVRHKIFLDGKSVVSRRANFNTTRSAFMVGRRVEEPNQYMDGSIDDVRIYNRALTDPEILDIYENQAGTLGHR